LGLEPGRKFVASPRLDFMVTRIMAKSILVTKKSRGRPKSGMGTQIGMRWHEPALKEIDNWRRQQADIPDRPQAIRRLVDLGLKAEAPAKPIRSTPNKLRAAEMAAKAIDGMIDPSAPPEERAQRRRRLTKGPEEFQEVRVDRPKFKK
jgi:hypothetical protein